MEEFVGNCHNILVNSKNEEMIRAKNYLVSGRNISDNSISIHKIGYCPFREHIPDSINFYKKNDEDVKLSKGYSYFIHGRVILPIYNEFGKIVSIATRKPSSEPGNTWWNFPFKKSNHLFLLDKTRKNIFEKNKIYVVEGYVDALILYQENLLQVSCLMGVHLSPRKIGLIARYCDNICFCLDVDKNMAGQNATNQAIYTLNEFGFSKSISVISLPEEGDPDNYVIKNGLPSFLSLEKRLDKKDIDKICKEVRKGRKR